MLDTYGEQYGPDGPAAFVITYTGPEGLTIKVGSNISATDGGSPYITTLMRTLNIGDLVIAKDQTCQECQARAAVGRDWVRSADRSIHLHTEQDIVHRLAVLAVIVMPWVVEHVKHCVKSIQAQHESSEHRGQLTELAYNASAVDLFASFEKDRDPHRALGSYVRPAITHRRSGTHGRAGT